MPLCAINDAYILSAILLVAAATLSGIFLWAAGIFNDPASRRFAFSLSWRSVGTCLGLYLMAVATLLHFARSFGIEPSDLYLPLIGLPLLFGIPILAPMP